ERRKIGFDRVRERAATLGRIACDDEVEAGAGEMERGARANRGGRARAGAVRATRASLSPFGRYLAFVGLARLGRARALCCVDVTDRAPRVLKGLCHEKKMALEQRNCRTVGFGLDPGQSGARSLRPRRPAEASTQ